MRKHRQVRALPDVHGRPAGAVGFDLAHQLSDPLRGTGTETQDGVG